MHHVSTREEGGACVEANGAKGVASGEKAEKEDTQVCFPFFLNGKRARSMLLCNNRLVIPSPPLFLFRERMIK